MTSSYYTPQGGLPPQTEIGNDRAIFTTAYAFIPKRVMTDIVTSFLPNWQATRLWVLARPMSGFAETFSHYLMEVGPGGGSSAPDDEEDAEHVLFLTRGRLNLTIGGAKHKLKEGGYAFIPPGVSWSLKNSTSKPASFHWIRKRYQFAPGIEVPPAFVTSDDAVSPTPMPDTKGAWATSRFVDPADLRHDMHVNIVTFEPGGSIPFAETHVMEHGLYVLEGKAVYRLNQDWIEVEEGDYMWLRAFCPQCCVASGPGRFRYLLYKDVNRHMPLP